MGGLQKAFVGVTAVLGTKKLIDNADALAKNARAAGFGFEEYQRLQHGFEEAGVSQTSFQKSTAKFSKVFLDASRGLGTANDSLTDLGLTFTDLEKLSPEERFKEVAGAIGEIQDVTKRQALSKDLFGKEFAATAFNIEDVVAEGEGLVTITEDAAKAAEGSNDAFLLMTKNLSNLSTNILGPLVENLTPVVEAFSAFAKEHPNIAQLGIGLGVVAAAFVVLGGPLTAIAALLTGGVLLWKNWDKIVAKLKDGFKKLFKPLTDVAKALGLISDEGEGLAHIEDAFDNIGGSGSYVIRAKRNIKEFSDELLAGNTTIEDFVKGVDKEMSKLPDDVKEHAVAFKDIVLKEFHETKSKAIDNSPIPDLVNGVDAWMSKLPTIASENSKAFKDNTLAGFKGAMLEASDVATKYKDLGTKVFDGLTDSLVNFTKTGKFNFKSFARDIINDLIKINIKASASKLFGAIGGGGGIGSIIGGLFGGFRANGGPVSSSKSYVVGEKGPELFTPKTDGDITPNGGNSSNTVINISGNVDERAIAQIRSVISQSPDIVGQGANYYNQSTQGLSLRRS